ncbi:MULTISPECIES: LysM peptidoglycan-binding domain-containing protein [unclassified Kaistella]|uniref:amino acid ABC transporter substrate-binding protein n=1 Tax=unclassified Kaistella TaxID=2762626 RepID=UPI002736EF44|nr:MULTISPECIES: LysM peptidoglycan-binding domain-containing protein [unclassified Kaistella]MDP2454913.1 LysM peptidoglycan-binding domain-containing protein [Kaistella sp. SH11-4b]MDP2456104.1 LysM peptidoglycan-binding domain-containing protein [Kaistella sp. SH40-3]MDP2460583.1 LysM peptidoglycan-binding domain-containing protein [Kaistella sp. SH19-2b]
MIKKFLITAGLTAIAGLSAQKTHTVEKGDNPYNIAKRYGMTVDDLVKLNPNSKDGKVTIGEVLLINKTGNNSAATPVKTEAKSTASTSKLGKIILKPKQTIYGITKQYQISETDLRKLNPDLDSHMKIGDEVTLPLTNIQKFGDAQQEVVATTETAKPVPQPEPIKAVETVAVDENSYTVQPKDNYFKLSRKFNLNQKELFALNPGLEAKGLQAGDVIVVKGTTQQVQSESKATAVSQNTIPSTYSTTSVSDDYVTYTVQDGDTVFGLLNKFGITLDDLLSLNPNLSQGLKSGMVLKIKKLDSAYVKKSGDALNVVLMLPFGFDSGDSKYRSLSLDFLSGAKLAIERNTKQGQKLDIKVIDAGNEKSFKNSLTQINQDNTDLIIGPFFKTSVLEVLNYVKNSKIPVVAPFANSEDLLAYQNLIIIETNDYIYADRIVKEVKDVFSDQKIYVVSDADESMAKYLESNLKKALKNPNVILVKSASDIQPDQNMMTGNPAPVIAILANNSDEAGDAFANRMIALSKNVAGVKSFSLYYSPIFEKKQDELSQSNLVYLMDRKIDTEGTFEKEILADYKKKYCKAPSKYAVIGFDVVNDMLSRENKKGEIFKQMNKVQTQLATKFEFEKTKTGAYVNKGYRVVRLIPN